MSLSYASRSRSVIALRDTTLEAQAECCLKLGTLPSEHMVPTVGGAGCFPRNAPIWCIKCRKCIRGAHSMSMNDFWVLKSSCGCAGHIRPGVVEGMGEAGNWQKPIYSRRPQLAPDLTDSPDWLLETTYRIEHNYST